MSDTDQQDQHHDQRDADQQDQHQHDTHEPDDLGDKGKAALKAERDARRAAEKERADLAKRLADIEKAQKEAEEAKAKEQGEWEKVATQREEELSRLQQQIAERDLNDKRAAVARKHSLPDEIADRLVGDDDDALEADAKRFAKLFAREDGPDTDSGKRSANGTNAKKQDSLLATYEFGKRR